MTISSRRLDEISRDAFARCVFPMTGRRSLTADLTAGPVTAGTRGCVAGTEFSHERSHVHGGQRSTEWIRLGAFTSDADKRRKWPRRCGDATREERRIFRAGKRETAIFRAESTYAQKSSPIRMYVYYELTSTVLAVKFYLGKRSEDTSQHPFAAVEAAPMRLVLIIVLR